MPAKNSVARTVRGKILEQMPLAGPVLDVVMPKKATLHIIKWCDNACIACHVSFLV